MKMQLDEVCAVTKGGNMQLTSAATKLLGRELRMLVLLSKPCELRDIVPFLPGASEENVLVMAENLRARGYLSIGNSVHDDGSIDFGAGDIALREGADQFDATAAMVRKVKAELSRRGFYVSIARGAAKQVPPVDGEAYQVLVIEDDPYLAKMYVQLLSMISCRAIVAANRAEVESVLRRSTRVDLVVLDLNLPDVGGFDLLHRLSSHETLGSTPVMVASADTTKESIIRALQLGADGYITKPIGVESLIDSIRAILGLPAIDRSKAGGWSGVVS